MSHLDPRPEPLPEPENLPLPISQEHDHPARRLLAHDLEHLAWDTDGEGPPPD